jgi:hypothetical protein
MSCHDKSIFVNQEMIEEMICSLCNGVFRDPVIDSCGHSFGRNCFQEYVKSHKRCPISQKAMSGDAQLSECKPVQNFISKLVIKCVHSPCSWTGILDSLKVHLGSLCNFQLVNCQYNECDYKGSRNDVKLSHENSCSLRLKRCDYCQEVMQFRRIEEHFHRCPKIIIGCPQNCLEDMRREEIAHHLTNNCQNKIVHCEMSSSGCTFTGKLKEVIEHQTSSAGSVWHLNMMTKSMAHWRIDDAKIMSIMLEKVGSLDKKIDVLSQTVISQKTEILALTQQIERQNSEREKKNFENLIKIEDLNETLKKSAIAMADSSPMDEDLTITIVASIFEREFNASFDKMKKGLENNLSDLKSDIQRIGIEVDSMVDIHFHQNFKSNCVLLLSVKEAVHNGTGILDFLTVSAGALALTNLPLIPNKYYRLFVTKQIHSGMAVGICLKGLVDNSLYEIPVGDWHGCYLFYADGKFKVNGKSETMSSLGSKMTFKSNDVLELLFDSAKRRLICKNLSSKTIAHIAIREDEDVYSIYPCVRFQEKNESIKII